MNVLLEAIEKYGKDSQCKMAIEEMSELTKELYYKLRRLKERIEKER